MSIEPLQAETLGTALHLIARQDVASLLAALNDTRSRHRGVHNARKAIRRLRSLLLLGRRMFGDAGEALDVELKALGLGLSSLRDAHVAVELASARTREARSDAAKARWATVRTALVQRRTRCLRAALDDDPLFAARRNAVELHAASIDALPWHALDRDNVQRELRRSVRRMQRAQKRADTPDADAETRHRWRRRLRRLRMQWKAIKDLRRNVGGTVDADVHALLAALHEHAPRLREVATAANALGASQDRQLLRTALGELPESADVRAARRGIRSSDGTS